MNEENQQTEIVVISKHELHVLITDAVKQAIAELKVIDSYESKEPSTFIYGIKGLANFLNVSLPTAQLWKNQRVFPYVQRGRTIIFKSNEVLEAMGKSNSKK